MRILLTSLFLLLSNLYAQNEGLDFNKANSASYQFEAHVRNAIRLVCKNAFKETEKLGNICKSKKARMDLLVEINFRARLSGGNQYWNEFKDKTVKEMTEIIKRIPKDDQHLFKKLKELDKRLEGLRK